MMYSKLEQDAARQPALLADVLKTAEGFLTKREDGFASPAFPGAALRDLPAQGLGAEAALDLFKKDYAPYMALSSGPRFFGYVIGGVTPAALAGDWLTALYDQNAFGMNGNVDRQIELEAVRGLRELLVLPEDFTGAFTSGATMASTVALAVAREWAAQREGKSADDGIYGLTPPHIVSASAHPSIYKGLSILGMGRALLETLPALPNREALDVAALERYLAAHKGEPVIVIANMGTANSGDLDDLKAIAALKTTYEFYLHADGAVGAIAAASPQYRHLFDGVELADSFTVDCHKWLNTTYDCAITLVRGKTLGEYQYRVFAQAVRALPQRPENVPFTEIGPEGSRRMRALPVWLSLQAYGKAGYAAIVENCCALTRRLQERLSVSPALRMLHPVYINGLAFTLALPDEKITPELMARFSAAIRERGVTFLNPAKLCGVPVLRCSLSNWHTTERDVDAVAESVIAAAECLMKEL